MDKVIPQTDHISRGKFTDKPKMKKCKAEKHSQINTMSNDNIFRGTFNRPKGLKVLQQRLTFLKNQFVKNKASN